MRNGNFSEDQLHELENELRGYGSPFSGPEPDSRYFANFRSLVMERIREEEARKATPWYASALGWIEEHLLISSVSTAGMLVAVWAALMMQPLDTMRNEELGIKNKQVAVNTQQPQDKVETQPMHIENDVQIAAPETKKLIPHSSLQIPNSRDMAMAYVPVATAGDVGPVSLDELSAPELESVLNTLETE